MRRATILGPTASLAMTLLVAVSRAQIYRWDIGQVIAATERITPGSGVWLERECGSYREWGQAVFCFRGE